MERIPWIVHGLLAGMIGAFSVAVIFLILDWANGRPLWTPSALGSVFFLGEPLARDAAPRLPLVAGYTLLHGAIFLSISLPLSFALMTEERLPASGALLGLLAGGALFIGFQVIFFAFAALFSQFDPDLTQQLGVVRISGANLVAAALMAGFLVRRRSVRRELR
jgi:hypothetical protein